MAVYAISHAPLANALLAAHARGVRVRVLVLLYTAQVQVVLVVYVCVQYVWLLSLIHI